MTSDWLAQSALPRRWAGRECFVIAQTGFGRGENFLAAWAAWRGDPQRCERLDYLAVAADPSAPQALPDRPRDGASVSLAQQLHEAWPPATPDLHGLAFDDGRVRLHLAFGEADHWLAQWVAPVDAFCLEGIDADRPAGAPDRRWFKALSRLAAAGATLWSGSASASMREGLRTAGFAVQAGAAREEEPGFTFATFDPPATRGAAPPGRPRVRAVPKQALILGAGLAGCAAAWALAEQGWHSTVVERHERPARDGSGNPGGMFHGVVTPQDGLHARWHRAAALAIAPVVRAAVQRGGVRGAVNGLLRMEFDAAGVADMQSRLRRLGLPPDYVQALDAVQASQHAGLALRHPAWFYPTGGWVDPAGLAAHYLQRAGSFTTWRGAACVERIQREDGQWQLLDAAGRVIDRSSTLVLANAGDALRLLGHPPWPIEPVRGQISMASADALALPALPLAGAGYVLPALADCALFGATAQRHDMDGAVRLADHARNLAQLERLTGSAAHVNVSTLQGRTGWRWSAADRLPVIGGVPDDSMPLLGSGDQPRFVPRRPGLFVFSALGSRGISASALGARLLAAWVTGAPAPVGASLMDAVDPARFTARARRRSGAGVSPRSGRVRPA